jgi:para-nitrobenzyl esterase
MTMSTHTTTTRLALVAALLLSACGDDDKKDTTPADLGADMSAQADMPADMPVPADMPTTPGDMPDDMPTRADMPADMMTDMPADMMADMPNASGCQVGAPAGAGQVATDHGLVQGALESPMWAYKGIPFAAPPVGDLRWRAPQPAACWEGVKQTSSFGARCPQLDANGQAVGDEDCLTINVWTPDKAAPAGGWPVMFFVHGGGNIQGASSEALVGGKPIYDGRLLGGAQDVVVVTMNYRLGALGFLTLPALDAEAPGSGNWGLLDVIAALEWTRDNIAAFHGDPGRVMLFGESAGAVNVCAMLTAEPARGLFHSALMESGGCFSTPRAIAQQDAAALIADSSCANAADQLACLRALDGLAIVEQLPASLESLSSPQLSGGLRTFSPTHGADALLKVEPLAAITAGDFARVPFVVGTNLEEMANLLGLPTSLTEAQYAQTVRAAFLPFGAGVADEVLALYPADATPTPRDTAVQLYSDMRFTCPARAIVRAARAHQPEVWRYFFTRRATTRQGETPAQHAIELVYVFGSIISIPLYVPAPEDLAVSATIQRYWASLARVGHPNDGAQVMWPAYQAAPDTTLELGTTVRALDGVHADKCDYFEALVAGL